MTCVTSKFSSRPATPYLPYKMHIPNAQEMATLKFAKPRVIAFLVDLERNAKANENAAPLQITKYVDNQPPIPKGCDASIFKNWGKPVTGKNMGTATSHMV
mmetsp:Transcript_9148/g.18994  ORF Transcript_9148/g.18994 Transcript_9148/m.18994 type:complete len:101 (-) Transcript_9148:711-1013(-)